MSERQPLALVPENGETSGDARPDAVDTGIECLCLIARFHSLPVEAAQISHAFRAGSTLTAQEMLLAARQLGLSARASRLRADRLGKASLPAVAVGKDGTFVVLAKLENGQCLIHDPRAQRAEVRSSDEFEAWWGGELIQFASRESMAGELARFDFTWFIPAIVKYRRLLAGR